MKTEQTHQVKPREVKALIDSAGKLYLPFDDHRLKEQKNVVISKDGIVRPNGTGSLEILSVVVGRTPLYEGDSITITF